MNGHFSGRIDSAINNANEKTTGKDGSFYSILNSYGFYDISDEKNELTPWQRAQVPQYNQNRMSDLSSAVSDMLTDFLSNSDYGVLTQTVQDIVENLGSVQHVTWLDEHEKLVFRNAFETDQKAILRLAAQRQRKIDQMQSLNLWFDGSEDEGYIGEVMLEALLDEDIHSVYYAYSRRGVSASKGECLACQ